MKQPAVYILSNKTHSVLYVGVTSNLTRRIYLHKQHCVEGFTKRYNVHNLVYFELFDDMENAIYREKRLKRWERSWKVRLIEQTNPEWLDLYYQLL
ncbi:GIY-YIG nuclease family protein [Thalassotalea ponticola]|uniref:GIY-YIG nuclease family protein n=1 Tax=Thalassotalea ponticola TaxID=1523392 RepID=UPI0025B4E62F|nr:GIY-YIG nuclease family protein [Thalassotalea ponticola]MDN3652638.1 GIY-YIG nuclease family protein [Thalassotalea ponticola]